MRLHQPLLALIAALVTSTAYGFDGCRDLFAPGYPAAYASFQSALFGLRAQTNVQDFPDARDGEATLPPKGSRPADVADKLHSILLDAQDLLAQKGRITRFGSYRDADGTREILELVPQQEPADHGLDFVAYRLRKRFGVRVIFDPYFFSRYRSNAFQDGRTIALPARSIFEGKIPPAMEHETIHLFLDLLARQAATQKKGELPLFSSVSATKNSMPSSYQKYFRFDETIAHTIDLLSSNGGSPLEGDTLSTQFAKELRSIVPRKMTEGADEQSLNKGFEEWPEKIRSFGEIMTTVAETARTQKKSANLVFRPKRGSSLPMIAVTFKLKRVAWKNAPGTTDVRFVVKIFEPDLVQDFARTGKNSRKLSNYIDRYLAHQASIGLDIQSRSASLKDARETRDRARYLKELRDLELSLLEAYYPHALP